MSTKMTRKQFVRGLPLLLAGSMALRYAGGVNAAPVDSNKPSAMKNDSTYPITAELADFVARTKYNDLPSELIELGKKHILDAIGLAIAGEKAETGPIVQRYLSEQGVTTGLSSVLGTSIKTTPRFAAFANGVAIHADDFDDTQLALEKDRIYGLLTHPTVTTFTSSLAMAEALGKTGRDFMLAYHLGLESATKVCESIAPRSYESGFHSTSMCGVFGSASSAGKLRQLNVEQLRNAFGTAGARASGLRENFGTMCKPYQAGVAAEAGIVAADLAALGWTGAENILEAKRGFFSAFGNGWNPDTIVGKLGKPWSLLSPGVSIKPYPSGSLTHPAMDELARLIEIHNIKSEDVRKVRVGTNKHMLNTLIHHKPENGLQAKFSMEYSMAILLATGKAGLGEYADDVAVRPEIKKLVEDVEFYNNPEADAAGLDKMRSYVEVILKNGRTYTAQSDFAKGSPEKPMSFSDVVQKFTGCTAYAGLSRSKADRIVSIVQRLEDVDNMRNVFSEIFS